MNTVEYLVPPLHPLASWTDDEHTVPVAAEGRCFLPDSPIEWDRQVLDEDKDVPPARRPRNVGRAIPRFVGQTGWTMVPERRVRHQQMPS